VIFVILFGAKAGSGKRPSGAYAGGAGLAGGGAG